jgi:tetratricopeptide (TPR) repeat protein
LNAGDVEAHHGYGELLCALGHDEQGLREIREGLRLDPLSLDHQTAFGLALRYTRHYEQAIGQLQRVLAEDPDWLPARRVLSLTYEAMDRRHEAVREHLRLLNQLLVRESAMPVVHELTAEYERGGWNAFWRRELAVATQDVRGFRVVWRRGPGSDRNAFMMATRLARLGERARALEWLERAYEDRDHLLVFLDREPLFDDLRCEPTFQHLRRRIGLTQ